MNLPERLIRDLSELAHQDDHSFDALKAAFLVSKILKPSARLESYDNQISDIIAQLDKRFRQLCNYQSVLEAKVSSLQLILSQDMGFHGDEDAFDDLDHLNLFSVLDHKCGTALSLSLLYLHCAQACGWSIHALNFPGYSLICLDESNKRTILDPFHGCVEIDTYTLRQMIKVIGGAEAELQPELYQNLSPKTLSMRYIASIKAHFLRCQQIDKALDILQASLCLEPESAAFWRETGLLQARTGQLEEAIDSLNVSLKYTTDGDAIRHVQHIVQDLEKKTED
ncbi:transglutaminase-like domain-containing protein [Terasakiella sp. SH-1]|uniref:transglutaminase family protein n=1 Tax=Terasakiella sp. SH-1 TaxID=2560057 RepID=UPI0010740707|nr:transglutaminase-like domain-containing protein [Terasakiella sp. SH-1]